MFTMVDPNTAASDEGFSVKALGRAGLEYREGPRSADVDSEMLFRKCGIAVYKDSFKAWMPPFEVETVSEEERDRVVDNICRAFEFQKMRVEIVDRRLGAEAIQRTLEDADARSKMHVVRRPRVGILDFGGAESKPFIASDTIFLTAIFGRVKMAELINPSCDVLFLYAKLASDGALIGSTRDLAEIIRDTGARIVVFGLANNVNCYHQAVIKMMPRTTANLIETLDRRGDAFERFLTGIFLTMKRGASMCTALGYDTSSPRGLPRSDRPLVMIEIQLDPFTFGE